MDHSVRFEDEESADDLAIAPPKPITLVDKLMQFKVVNSPYEAMMLIGIFTLLLISASIYLLASAVPPPPTHEQTQEESPSLTP